MIKSESGWVRYEASLRWPLVIAKRSDLNIVFAQLVDVFCVKLTCKNMSLNHKLQLVRFLDKIFIIVRITATTNDLYQRCQMTVSFSKLALSERLVYIRNCFLLWLYHHVNVRFISIFLHMWIVEFRHVINTTLCKTFLLITIATKWVSYWLEFMDAWCTSWLNNLP